MILGLLAVVASIIDVVHASNQQQQQQPRIGSGLIASCRQAIFDRTQGVFQTPGILQPPSCFLYHFATNKSYHIEVNFLIFEVPKPVGPRCVDFVRVYDEAVNNSLGPKGLDFCGKGGLNPFPVFVSKHNDLYVLINAASNAVLVKGEYRIVNSEDYSIDAEQISAPCEYRVQSLRGQLYSPQAPFYAPVNTTCTYAFPVLKGYELRLNVTNLSLSSMDCHENSLTIYYTGPGQGQVLVERLCRPADAPYSLASRRALRIVFQTGWGKKEDRIRGFHLVYEYAPIDLTASSHTAPAASSIGVSHNQTTLLAPAMWAAILGSNPITDGSRCPVRIVSTLSDDTSIFNRSGIITSEHYAPTEIDNFKCQFVFVGAPEEHVRVTFKRFKLFTWRDKGVSSSMEIRCEEMDHVTAHVLVGSRMSKIHDFCGTEIPPPIMSAKNILTLDYVVRSIGGGRQAKPDDDYGFIIEYQFINGWGPQPPEAIKDPENPCVFSFNSSVSLNGHFWSANHPGFYPRNLDCSFLFHGTETQIVVIHFEYFDVEGFGLCEEATHSDYVLFSNYRTIDRTNRRYCGAQKPPGAIASESNYFRMLFRTNDIFDGTGFYGHYQFIDQQSRQSTQVKLATGQASTLSTDGFYRRVFIVFLILCCRSLFFV